MENTNPMSEHTSKPASNPISKAMSPNVFLLVITLLIIFQPVATDVYLPVLPTIAKYFHTTAADVQRTLTFFMLGFALSQLFSGPMTDRFGRKPLGIVSIVFFMMGSLVCMLANSVDGLVLGRFIQGFGACTALIVARAMVRDTCNPQAGATMLSKSASFLALAPLIGPLISSYLLDIWTWRGAFILTLFFAVAAGSVMLWKIQETLITKNPKATQIMPMLRGYAFIAQSPKFWTYTAMFTLSFGGLFAYISSAALVYVDVLGLSAKEYALCFCLTVPGYIAGTFLLRYFLPRVGMATSLRIGAGLQLCASLVLLALAALGIQHWAAVMFPTAFFLMGYGFISPVCQAGAATEFADRAGAVAGLMGFVQTMGAAGVGAWIGFSYNHTVWPLFATQCVASALACILGMTVVKRYA